MDAIQQELLAQVAGLHEVPEGAYNIRANGEMAGRNTTANAGAGSCLTVSKTELIGGI